MTFFTTKESENELETPHYPFILQHTSPMDSFSYTATISYSRNLALPNNSAVATGLEKVSFHSNPKECSNYRTVALISHAMKVMLKILQARLQQYMNCELPDVQAGFRKGRGTRD